MGGDAGVFADVPRFAELRHLALGVAGKWTFSCSPGALGKADLMAPAIENGVNVEPAEEDAPGAAASFPYDAMLVDRFRRAFPRARWREDRRAWFVPGTRAERRVSQWLEREFSNVLAYAMRRARCVHVQPD